MEAPVPPKRSPPPPSPAPAPHPPQPTGGNPWWRWRTAADLIDEMGEIQGAADQAAAIAAFIGRIDATIDEGIAGEVLRIVETYRALAAITKVCIESRLAGR